MHTIPEQLDIKFEPQILIKQQILINNVKNFVKNYTNFRFDRLRLKPRFMPRYLSQTIEL